MRRARLGRRARVRRIRVRRLGGGLSQYGGALGPVRAGREAGRPGGHVPPMALPPRHHGGARDRLQAGHGRHLRRELPAPGDRSRALSRAVARAHGALNMSETELKFDLPPRAGPEFRKLARLAPADPSRARLLALYFDTPGCELAKHGMALRLRRSGRTWKQALKSGASGAGGLHSRDEWED